MYNFYVCNKYAESCPELLEKRFVIFRKMVLLMQYQSNPISFHRLSVSTLISEMSAPSSIKQFTATRSPAAFTTAISASPCSANSCASATAIWFTFAPFVSDVPVALHKSFFRCPTVWQVPHHLSVQSATTCPCLPHFMHFDSLVQSLLKWPPT